MSAGDWGNDPLVAAPQPDWGNDPLVSAKTARRPISDVAEPEPTATEFATEAVTGYPQRVARDFLASEELGQRAGTDLLRGQFKGPGEAAGLTLASLAGYLGGPMAPVSAALDPVADIVDYRISKPVQEMTNLGALQDAFGLVPKGQKPTATGIPHELTTSAIMALPALLAPEGARVGEEARAPRESTSTAPQGIRAFHGSPHEFDRFDVSQLGTGEGAQSIAHGLYFAENKKVAQTYQSEIAGPGKGHLYQVDIAAPPNTLLQWDRPFSQQPPQVQNAIRNTLDPSIREGFLATNPTGEAIYERLRSFVPGGRAFGGGQPKVNANARASELLRSNGVRGIKYRDQGSRTTGPDEKTHNYVIFDHNDVRVVSRDGKPIRQEVPTEPAGDDPHMAAVQTLQREGVSLTPGQRRGGVAKTLEDAHTSMPGVGDVIKSGQRNSVESLNRAAINRSLRPVGGKLPDAIPPGHDAIDYAQRTLSDAYGKLLPSLKIVPDQEFPADLKQIMHEHRDMDPGQLQTLGRMVNREVLQPLQRSPTGETAKSVEEWLGHEVARNMKSDDYNVRHLGLALEDVQDSLRAMIERANPEYAAQLKKINEGYANFKRVQRAAAASRDGVFSPAQLDNAVKMLDRSKDRGTYARGRALMQDLSSAAVKVLPSSVPDSGTPTRMLAALLLGGQVNPMIPIGALTAAYPYSRMAMARAAARAGSNSNILRTIMSKVGVRNPLEAAQRATTGEAVQRAIQTPDEQPQ